MFKHLCITLLYIIGLSLSFSEEVRWETVLPGKVIGSPVERRADEVVLICEDRRVYSINTVTGSINWKVKPGERLNDLKLSNDGSIIVSGEKFVSSLYADGHIRWKISTENNIEGSIKLSLKGDIGFYSDGSFYIYNRFGSQVLVTNSDGPYCYFLQNALILLDKGSTFRAITFGGSEVWDIEKREQVVDVITYNNRFYVVYNDGIIKEFNNNGQELGLYKSQKSITGVFKNYINQMVFIDETGVTSLLSDNIDSKGLDSVLLFSNGILLQSMENWSIRGVEVTADKELYPSGQSQLLDQEISLSHNRVWNDHVLEDYYIETILSGNRTLQKKVLDEITQNIDNNSLLDDYPNFYTILLLASSSINPNDDIRQEAYRIMGDSRNLMFLPYLFNNLKSEKSYHIIPSIFYALGRIGVDPDGRVIDMIVSRMDDYYDEKLVLEAMYALYYINRYTGGDNIDKIFTGVEKILEGGYSRKIESECYRVLKLMK